jgi:hypothetical protein
VDLLVSQSVQRPRVKTAGNATSRRRRNGVTRRPDESLVFLGRADVHMGRLISNAHLPHDQGSPDPGRIIADNFTVDQEQACTNRHSRTAMSASAPLQTVARQTWPSLMAVKDPTKILGLSTAGQDQPRINTFPEDQGTFVYEKNFSPPTWFNGNLWSVTCRR